MISHKSAQHERVTSASRAPTEKPAPQRVNDASHDFQSRDDHHSKRATRSYDFDERVIIQIVDHDDENSEFEHKIESDVSHCSCNEGNPDCQRCSDLFSDPDVSEAVEREVEADYGSACDYSPIQYISYGTYAPPATNEDLFRTLSMDRRNLVLDSVDPEVAPHIVITPPPFDWDDCFTAYNMRTCPQDPGFLMVPQSGGWEMQAVTLEPAEYVELAQVEQGIAYVEMIGGEMQEIPDNEPLKVFSRSKFERQISASLDTLEYMSSIHRQRCKQIAELTARRAPQILETLSPSLQTLLDDNTFTWTDPAEALLADMVRYCGTTVLVSENPFAAPHIVINEPPPMGSEVAATHERNSTPYQCATGYNLCVPNWYYGFSPEYYYEYMALAQLQPHWTDTHAATSWPEDQATVEAEADGEESHHVEHWEVFDDHTVDPGQMQDEALAVSRPETPMPSTPTDDGVGPFNFMPSIALESVDDLLHGDVDSPVTVSTSSAQSLCALMAKGSGSGLPTYVFGDFSDSCVSDDREDSCTPVPYVVDIEVPEDCFAQPCESTPCSDSAAYHDDEDEDGPPPFDEWYTSWTPQVSATA